MKLINSILKSFFSITLTSKIIDFFKALYNYAKDYGYVSDIIYSDGFKKMIRQYIHVDLEKDWIGRLYGVINPNIDINGNFNLNNVIIEIDNEYTNNNEYVKTWIYKQLNLIQELFNLENLYNYISLDIKHVGPAIADNYLLIFDIASRKKIGYCLKRMLLQSILYIIVALGIIYFIL